MRSSSTLSSGKSIGLAEALFDNVAEWPDELAFRQGDLLRVLDERPGDGVADGWWLCADQRGRRGIVPANRLRMMHRFGLHENRVITPQRFGDVFLYNNGRFPPFNDDFTSSTRTVGGSTPFGLGDAFSSLSLIHGPERAFPLSPAERFSSLRRPADQPPPTIRDIPIRIEGTPGVNRVNSHRGSPPPPPQRKYFHLMTPTTTSSSSEDERHRIGGGAMTRSLTNGDNAAFKLGAEDVSWRRSQLGTTTVPDDTTDSGVHLLHPAGASQDEQRGSVASSVSLSASERSSLSDPPDALSSALGQASAASSSVPSTYDVPSRLLHRPGAAQLSSKPPLAPKPAEIKKNENGSTSVLLNVLEGLYDMPNRARSSTEPVRSPAALTGQRPWTRFRQTAANSGSNGTADDVAHSIYDVPKSAMLNANSSTSNGNVNSTVTSSLPFSVAVPTTTTTSIKPSPASNLVIDRLISNQRKLEACAQKMQSYTAPKYWRQPHVLQQYLMEIRETVTDVAMAIDDFVDTTARISIDRNDDQSNQLATLLSPLRDSKALIARLKRTLDSTGWTLAALSRPKNADGGNDALDQFVAVVKQIPNDCRQMVQWAQTNPAIVFIRADPADPSASSERRSLKTLSADSGGVAAVASAELASAAAALPQLSANSPSSVGSTVTPSVNQPQTESRVLEEDDLHSIASDRESLFDDYDFVDGRGHEVPPATTNGNHHAKSNGTADKVVGAVPPNGTTDQRRSVLLTEEDRHILSFYSPQIDDHTDCLSSAIEEFLTSVEEQQPPKEFVQRSKLVILAAHKLVYIGDNVAQCVHAGQLSADVRRAADRLCAVLKECVSSTKTAAEKYPAVAAVQAMVDTIVGVSHAAHDLKLLVRQSIR